MSILHPSKDTNTHNHKSTQINYQLVDKKYIRTCEFGNYVNINDIYNLFHDDAGNKTNTRQLSVFIRQMAENSNILQESLVQEFEDSSGGISRYVHYSLAAFILNIFGSAELAAKINNTVTERPETITHNERSSEENLKYFDKISELVLRFPFLRDNASIQTYMQECAVRLITAITHDLQRQK